MVQHGTAGLSAEAESFQHLEDLEVDHVHFRRCRMQLPHMLQRVAFRDVLFLSALGLEKCKCATIALEGKHGARQQSGWPVPC